MEPIINPIYFYLMGVSETLWGISVALFIVSILSFMIFVGCYCYNKSYGMNEGSYYDDNRELAKICYKWLIVTGILSLIFMLLVIFIPRKETLIQMIMASGITMDNLKTGVDGIKEATDYIINAIKELR